MNNLEEKAKHYDEIEPEDYIPIYGWVRYQLKSIETGYKAASQGAKEYFRGFVHASLRTAWLSLYNAGLIYSAYKIIETLKE